MMVSSGVISQMAAQFGKFPYRQYLVLGSQRFLRIEISLFVRMFRWLKSFLPEFYQRTRDLQKENERLRQQYEQILQENRALTYEVNHDNLTGLQSRRYYEFYSNQAFQNAALLGQSLSLLVIDIDYFKRYNDTHGHQAGDKLLQKIGQCLLFVVQKADGCVARYGGEEFVVVLPSHDSIEALAVAQKIQRTVITLGITVSIGLASYGQDGRTPSDLLHCADLRMYAAKQNGRNRIE